MIKRKKVYAIVMAAGKGTRLGVIDKPKVMTEVAGKPIIDWAVAPFFELKKEGVVDRIILIIGYLGEQVENHLKGQVDFVWQKEQLGTAHAVRQTEGLLKDEEGIVLIVNGDHPLYTKETYLKMLKKLTKEKLTLAFATATTPDRFDSYGRVVRDEKGKILGVVEKLDASEKQIEIPEKSINLYAVDNKWLFETLPRIKANPIKHEYYIVDIVKFCVDERLPIEALEIDNLDEALGVNTPGEMEEAEIILEKIQRSKYK